MGLTHYGFGNKIMVTFRHFSYWGEAPLNGSYGKNLLGAC